jgi:hypothetical protein
VWDRNSAHGMIYVPETTAGNETTQNSMVAMAGGPAAAGERMFLRVLDGTGKIDVRINNIATSVLVNRSVARRRGCVIGSRTVSGTVNVTEDNNAAVTSGTATSASMPANITQRIGNFNGTSNTVDRFGAASLGGGLTVSEQEQLYDNIHAFMTAIGANFP